jgi:predicted secreted hydrolase
VPTQRIVLPGDDAVLAGHPVQWWYWTGHLESLPSPGIPAQEFGFEVIFFVIRKGLFWGTLGHAALSDVQTRAFMSTQQLVAWRLPEVTRGRFSLFVDWHSPLSSLLGTLRNTSAHIDFPDLVSRRAPENGAGPMAPALTWEGGNGISAIGGGGQDHLSVHLDGYEMELCCTSPLPATQYYGGWAHPYACGGYTYYFSRPRMAVSGSLKAPGMAAPMEVKGDAWFDRQFGRLDPMLANGYQWIALILDDGRELMLASLCGKVHETDGYAALHEPGRPMLPLGPREFEVDVLERWTSPVTGCVYPVRWRVRVPSASVDLLVVPVFVEQELVPPRTWWARLLENPYWEGKCDVLDPSGRRVGRGYAESNNFR